MSYLPLKRSISACSAWSGKWGAVKARYRKKGSFWWSWWWDFSQFSALSAMALVA
jgi:hypothetical protein